MRILLLRVLFRLGEELFCSLGEGTGQGVVADLAHDEVTVGSTGSLAVELEGILALVSQTRIIAEEVPVACVDSLLLFELRDAHAALDAVVDTGSVADDQRRTVVAFRLDHCLEHLIVVSAHRDLRGVDIAVAHGDRRKVFLLHGLTGSSELRNGADRGSLGSLSAGVGVNLGVEDEDVDVLAGSDDVIQTAEADIISPAVAAEDPHGLLRQLVLVNEGLFRQLADLLVVNDLLELSDQGVGSGTGGGGVGDGVEVVLAGSLQRLVLGCRFDVGDITGESAADGVLTESHTETELGVVLEQGVLPSGTVALLVGGVRRRGCGCAPDGGAAGRVRDEHSVAEQLGDELGIRRLAAACACAGEFEQGLLELAALDGADLEFLVDSGLLVDGHAVIEHSLCGSLGVDGLHHERLLALLARADLSAGAAAGAVERGNGHGELVFLETGHRDRLGAGGSGGDLFIGHRDGTDNSVRAHDGASAALDTILSLPLGNVDGDAALLECGGAVGAGAVHVIGERGDGQLVALVGVDGLEDAVDILNQRALARYLIGNCIVGSVEPLGGDLDLLDVFHAAVDRSIVHVDDRLALLHVGLLRSVLHVLLGFLGGDDVGDLEERGLQNGVDSAAETDLFTDLDGVDGVEVDLSLGKDALHRAGQSLAQLLNIPCAVEQEGAALFEVLNDLVLVDIGGVVAGDEVSLGDVVGGFDGGLAETQVGYGQAARLLGVIGEVALCVHVGVVADDLDGVLVGADGAVCTETPELTAVGACGSGVGILDNGQRKIGNVIDDADGELSLGSVGLGVSVDRDDVSGGGVLGAETVSAAVNLDAGKLGIIDRSQNIQIEGLADGAGFLGSVENGEALDGVGQLVDEILADEGTIESDLEQTDLLARRVQVVDDLLCAVADGAHGNDDVLGIGSTVVVEGLVVGADLLVDLVHVFYHDLGNRVIVGVACLSCLEEDIVVLGGTAGDRMLGVQRAAAEFLDRIPIEHVSQIGIIPFLDLLDLVRGAEAVEEVQEGHSALDGGQVSDGGEIHTFLRIVGAEHRVARLTAGVYVGVVAEDGKRVAGERTGGYMDHARQQLACHFVHIRDHQEQTLRCSVGGSQGARSE